jgi:SAM-dependent methyltransferase
MIVDVPSPIDLRNSEDAREWASKAMEARPWRVDFFNAFHHELSRFGSKTLLDLGSGPGFLASHLLTLNPAYHYTALDFSAAMHQLAVERLGELSSAVRFVERSFRDECWGHGLGPFDAVVTHQAVHELRHKAYASTLHTQVKRVLKPGGVYLVCDHFVGDGGMENDQLYMTIEEQRDALLAAGFDAVVAVLAKGGLILHRAT